jgi:hypothetical protein
LDENYSTKTSGGILLRRAALTILFLLFTMHHVEAQAAARDTAEAPGISPRATDSLELPENPQTQRAPNKVPSKIIDKKFVAVMAALGAAESLRLTTRDLVLEREMAAGASWVTSVPSHSHLVFKYAPIFAAELAVAYEIKKPHDWLPGDRVIRKLWWLYPAVMGPYISTTRLETSKHKRPQAAQLPIASSSNHATDARIPRRYNRVSAIFE